MAVTDVILVLGMHRSGTSSVAGVLSKLGAALPQNLMTGDNFNAKGYFESNVITEFNDKLLAAAGTGWSDWRRFDPSWLESKDASDFHTRAVELFSSEFASVTVAVLKDPRICRIAPFWLDVFREMGVKPHILIPIRSPVDVAKSLSVDRGYAPGLALRDGYLLWLRHVLDAEWHTRALPRSIFSWRSFLTDWRSVCKRFSRTADLKLLNAASSSHSDVDEFLSGDLVHHATEDEDLCTILGDRHWARLAYKAMCELCSGGETKSAFAALDDIRERFDEASDIFGPEISLGKRPTDTAAVPASGLQNAANDPEVVALLALLVHQAQVLIEEQDRTTCRLQKMAAGQKALMDSNRRLLAELEAAIETSARLMTELENVRRHNRPDAWGDLVQDQIFR